MNYKLISMDFDGTLLTSNKQVTERNKKILLKYKNDKYVIVGITARNLSSVKSVCDINMFNYLILNNGSYIYDVENKDGIGISNIDKQTQFKITQYFKNIAEQIDYCSLNKYYIYKKTNPENKDYMKKVLGGKNDKSSICVFRKYMQVTNGRIYIQGPNRQKRIIKLIFSKLCCNKY